MTPDVVLREVTQADFDVLFTQQLDPIAIQMAAFGVRDPADRAAFDAHWNKILADDQVVKRAIVYQGRVAGNVLSFIAPWSGKPEVSYWLGREFWGQGIATAALRELLAQLPTRPLHARAARDNIASRRVLEKCGFAITGYDVGYAQARGREIEEVVMELR